MSEAINYQIFFDRLNQHLLTVKCIINRPSISGQRISLPSWLPGSYVIRNFSKHLVDIQATSSGTRIEMNKVNKNTWECVPCQDPLEITYHCYCFDNAPRGAYVDNERVFFDGSRIFIVVEGEEEQTHSVHIVRPDFVEEKNWRCATSMPIEDVDADGFGIYTAANHLELIDHPFEISNFKHTEFDVAGIPHIFVIQGADQVDMARIAKDTKSICEGHVNYFGEIPDIEKYIFITHAFGNNYGGIEHRSSSALACSRKDLPLPSNCENTEEYISFMGLVSHEYFHMWNVKRIKPEVFVNPDLYNEVYTRQLWIFEGITAYLDNLNLVRQGLISKKEYLQLLKKDINRLQLNPGSYVQTLEEASFDAWIKFYLPDENSINSNVSYYLKGSLVALALDLLIIQNSKCNQSLADVMQVLWQQYGKTGLGLPEDYFARVVFEVTGDDYSDFLAGMLQTTDPIPLPELLLNVGVIFKHVATPLKERFGWIISLDSTKLLIRMVLNRSVAEHAGLAPGDVIVAINGYEATPANYEQLFLTYENNRSVTLHYFRDEKLYTTEIEIPECIDNTVELDLVADVNSQQELQRKKWLD